jgi:hypothetical protein
MRSRLRALMSESATGLTAGRAADFSAKVSLSVPTAAHDGQLPNHCSAVAPHSEQT